MRDIRSRIGQPPGLELSDQQIQDLAARRLESILDPRVIDPTLLERLRKADADMPSVTTKPSSELLYTFDHTTIYERIWGYDFGSDSKALQVYIGYLRRKTEEEGEPRLLHTVRGVGYTVRPA